MKVEGTSINHEANLEIGRLETVFLAFSILLHLSPDVFFHNTLEPSSTVITYHLKFFSVDILLNRTYLETVLLLFLLFAGWN